MADVKIQIIDNQAKKIGDAFQSNVEETEVPSGVAVRLHCTDEQRDAINALGLWYVKAGNRAPVLGIVRDRIMTMRQGDDQQLSERGTTIMMRVWGVHEQIARWLLQDVRPPWAS